MAVISSSPTPWPRVSLTSLKWSRSSSRSAPLAPLVWQAARCRVVSVSNRCRFASPVSASCSVRWTRRSRCVISAVWSTTWETTSRPSAPWAPTAVLVRDRWSGEPSAAWAVHGLSARPSVGRGLQVVVEAVLPLRGQRGERGAGQLLRRTADQGREGLVRVNQRPGRVRDDDPVRRVLEELLGVVARGGCRRRGRRVRRHGRGLGGVGVRAAPHDQPEGTGDQGGHGEAVRRVEGERRQGKSDETDQDQEEVGQHAALRSLSHGPECGAQMSASSRKSLIIPQVGQSGTASRQARPAGPRPA